MFGWLHHLNKCTRYCWPLSVCCGYSLRAVEKLRNFNSHTADMPTKGSTTTGLDQNTMAIKQLNRSVAELNQSFDKLRAVIDTAKTTTGIRTSVLLDKAAALKDPNVDQALDLALTPFMHRGRSNSLVDDGYSPGYTLPEMLNSEQVQTIQDAFFKSKAKITRAGKLDTDDGIITRTEAEKGAIINKDNYRSAATNPNLLARMVVSNLLLDRARLPDPGFDVSPRRDATFIRWELKASIEILESYPRKKPIDMKVVEEKFVAPKSDSIRWQGIESVVAGLTEQENRGPDNPLRTLSPQQAGLAIKALKLARRLVVEGSEFKKDDGKITKKEAKGTLTKFLETADTNLEKLAARIFSDVTGVRTAASKR